MLEDLYAFREDLAMRGVFFCFCGPISQNLVKEIGDILEKKMVREDVKKLTIIRVFSMVVETAQNIIYYSDEKLSEDGDKKKTSLGIITVGHENGRYFVASGNRIMNNKIPNLEKKLTKIRGMGKKELKALFAQKIKEPPEEGSKGAGLGFIDMAKKASRPIDFDFKKIDENSSFFSVKVVI